MRMTIGMSIRLAAVAIIYIARSLGGRYSLQPLSVDRYLA